MEEKYTPKHIKNIFAGQEPKVKNITKEEEIAFKKKMLEALFGNPKK